MSDRWETVGPIKKPKKIKPPAPVVGQGEWPATNGGIHSIPGMNPAPTTGRGKGPKPKKHSAKTPASFPFTEEEEPIPDIIPGGGGGGDRKSVPKKSDSNKTPKKKPASTGSGDGKPKEKRRDLQGTLAQLSTTELLSFFRELQNAGSVSDVCLSWIKYSADALNLKLNQAQVIPPDPSQWPNDLNYPSLPTSLEQVMRTIISETVEETRGSLTDVLGISFASLLATLPTLIQRGDPGWGYLLFLRELCRVDPSLPERKKKSISELMDSYGNRKDIGLTILWSVAQAGMDSPYFLKIISYLLRFYQFKHYKQFILAALSTISCTSTMAVEYLIDGDEFEEFFETAYDPKKKRDLEKIYPRVKELVFKGLKGQGRPIFLKFIEKAGNKEFMPLSAYGQEVFSILLGCIENDPKVFDTWRDNLSKYSKESAAFLSYLSKVPESVKCGNQLETKLIQSDEFAVAACQNPELLRNVKKVQAGLERVAQSKRKILSWKLAIFVLLLVIGGLFWLDISENGKGTFEKSNTGKFLNNYGVLKEAVVVWDMIASMLKYIQEYATMLFRSINEGLQPLLQIINKKVQEYIPQLSEYVSIVSSFVTSTISTFIVYLQTNVFVGTLSPENLRKMTKDSLSFVWGNILYAIENLYAIVRRYVS